MRKVHWRWRDSWIDLKNDGMSDKEQIKGDTKKYLQKLTRNQIKRATKKEIEQTL